MAEKDKYCMKRFGKKYSECTAEQKAQCDKDVDKVEKGKGMCPSCGEKMEKGMCIKAGCPGMMKYGNVQKGPHHKEQSFDTKPGGDPVPTLEAREGRVMQPKTKMISGPTSYGTCFGSVLRRKTQIAK